MLYVCPSSHPFHGVNVTSTFSWLCRLTGAPESTRWALVPSAMSTTSMKNTYSPASTPFSATRSHEWVKALSIGRTHGSVWWVRHFSFFGGLIPISTDSTLKITRSMLLDVDNSLLLYQLVPTVPLSKMVLTSSR